MINMMDKVSIYRNNKINIYLLEDRLNYGYSLLICENYYNNNNKIIN